MERNHCLDLLGQYYVWQPTSATGLSRWLQKSELLQPLSRRMDYTTRKVWQLYGLRNGGQPEHESHSKTLSWSTPLIIVNTSRVFHGPAYNMNDSFSSIFGDRYLSDSGRQDLITRDRELRLLESRHRAQSLVQPDRDWVAPQAVAQAQAETGPRLRGGGSLPHSLSMSVSFT